MTGWFTDLLPPVAFTGSPLDRADSLRRDEAAMVAVRRDPAARWLVLDDLRPVVDGDALRWFARDAVPADAPSVFLGLADGAPRFAVAATGLGTAGDPRGVAAALAAGPTRGDAAIYAHARSLLDWHARHGFCATCAAPTRVAKAGYERICDACGAHHFPRTDPVVIMLALLDANGEELALVGRQPRFPRRFLSALAGFVEPGESLEEAVRRELFEEAGIVTADVRYVASQPWPFPSQLMIGCLARATGTGALTIDGEELEEARWVSKSEVRAALAGAGDWIAPPPLAIARTLLATWVNERHADNPEPLP
ncbi:MAG: NAD(+) diphosphatase [Sphingomonadaceae bacterium]|nr:NAD(+) diphosphatase [Sphingomonadaceae bacterium]